MNITNLIHDIILTIFTYLPITDKRNLIRTSTLFHKLSAHMPQIEKEFQKMINDTKFLISINYTGFYNPLYKYTIELIYDGYSHLIPEHYIISKNRIMHEYKKVYYRAALNGNLDMIKILLSSKQNYYIKRQNAAQVMIGAAEAGRFEILEWMLDNNYHFNGCMTAYAAKGNQFELFKWLINEGCKIDDKTCQYAMETENISMIKWLYENKPESCIYENPIHIAVSKGLFEIIKWLHKKMPSKMTKVCDHAIETGQLEILKWGLKYNYEINSYSDSIHGGYIHILEWLKENGYLNMYNASAVDNLCTNASYAGNLEVLKWSRMNGFPWDSEVSIAASRIGNLEMLKWVKENGCEIDKTVAYYAAEYGYFETLQWALNNGCKMEAELCLRAAKNGHLEILKWLRVNGCPWDECTCSYAAWDGHLELLQWAHLNGCPWHANTCSYTVPHNHLDILKWLRTNNCPWDDNLCSEAISHCNLDILIWITENGYIWKPSMYQKLMTSKDENIIQWAMNCDINGFEYLTTHSTKLKNSKPCK